MSAPLSPEAGIGETLRLVAERLLAADIDQSRLEARRLVMAATGLDLAGLVREEMRPLGPDAARLEALVERRLAHEPLSRILGQRGFFGLEFRLNAATLDPRPDTEVLVETVLDEMKGVPGYGAALELLDLGTGSGAILLALLHAMPQARGLGIDLAPEAVAMARENAVALGLAERASFREGDMLEGIEGRFDVIVSNPPYIPSGEIAGLEPEVRLFDPVLALDGGADGLDFYRRLAAGVLPCLQPGGLLAVEVGAGQAQAVLGLFAAAGFVDGGVRRDLGGIERVVFGRHSPK